MATRIQLRRGTAQQWSTSNPVLETGEIGIELDTLKFKIGNGLNWNSISSYANVTPAGLGNSLGDYIKIADQGKPGGPAELDSNGDLLVPENDIILWNKDVYDYTTKINATQPTADRTITLPDQSGTVITTGDTGTVTNTMLAGSIANAKLTNSSITVNGSSISLGGSATIKASTTNALTIGTGLSGTSFDGSGAVTIAINSSVATLNDIQSLSNKTLKGPVYLQSGGGAGGSNNYIDVNNSTGAVRLVSGYPLNLTASGDVVITATGGAAKVGSDTIVTLAASQTLTNKTLTSPVISTISNTGTLTLPTSTDTLVGKATTDTFTNKTFDTAGTGNSFKINGTAITAVSGTGEVALVGSPTFTGTVNAAAITTAGDVTVGGNLTVSGTTTTINSTILAVTDNNIEIAKVATPTDVTANGAGITIKGATNKTFNWYSSTGSLTSSENMDLASGKTYKIAGTDVLSGSTLGSGITSSSLTSVGTITSGIWNGTTIAVPNGGTGLTSYTAGDILYASASNTLAKLTAGTNGQLLTLSSGVPAWADAPITLPAQSGNSGKYLTTNGVTASWQSLDTIHSFAMIG